MDIILSILPLLFLNFENNNALVYESRALLYDFDGRQYTGCGIELTESKHLLVETADTSQLLNLGGWVIYAFIIEGFLFRDYMAQKMPIDMPDFLKHTVSILGVQDSAPVSVHFRFADEDACREFVNALVGTLSEEWLAKSEYLPEERKNDKLFRLPSVIFMEDASVWDSGLKNFESRALLILRGGGMFIKQNGLWETFNINAWADRIIVFNPLQDDPDLRFVIGIVGKEDGVERSVYLDLKEEKDYDDFMHEFSKVLRFKWPVLTPQTEVASLSQDKKVQNPPQIEKFKFLPHGKEWEVSGITEMVDMKDFGITKLTDMK